MIAHELTNKAERHYALKLDASGIPWERGRCFRFANSRYTPDFYLPIERVYVEIIGTRQRWSQIRKSGKLQAFKSHYPSVVLRVLDKDGNPYGFRPVVTWESETCIEMAVNVNTCKRCAYRWVPQVSEPVVCPRCKSYKWRLAPTAKAVAA